MQNQPISLTSNDLDDNGSLCCPNAKTGLQGVATHPKVFLEIDDSGHAACPYCGTAYIVNLFGFDPLQHAER